MSIKIQPVRFYENGFMTRPFALGISPEQSEHCGAMSLDIMGTILFKPNQAFGEGLFFDNRECKKKTTCKHANTRACVLRRIARVDMFTSLLDKGKASHSPILL